ncbi:LamG-like jellyroll fold domain-containing protein [Pseudoalteromonas spongiae]|uniref:LamG-like jellyroll fold domain-containing protein n=1 Tax=Pseudoalteromonas spongiae TaxID=298657 RepID=A0ABU8EXH7_9GAMM
MRFLRLSILFKYIVFIYLILFSTVTHIKPANAYGYLDIQRVRIGMVMARGLVLEGDLPIWAQYNDSGKTVGAEFPLVSYPKSYVLSAEHVNSVHQTLDSLKLKYGDRLQIMSVDAYNSAEFKTGIKTEIKKITIPDYYKSIVILDPKTLVSGDQDMVLLLARFDLNSIGAVDGSVKSLLLDYKGALIASSEFNIAFKAAFYDGERGDSAIPSSIRSLFDKTPYAPYTQSYIEVVAPYPGGAIPDEEGKWRAPFMLIPCPMFEFHYTTPSILQYYFGNFNHRGYRAGFSYQMLPGHSTCIGYDAIQPTDLAGLMAKVAIMGILASVQDPVGINNYFVDTTLLHGRGALIDLNSGAPVPITGQTKYVYNEPQNRVIPSPSFYFDGDDLKEFTLHGNLNAEGQFVCNESPDDATYYGVYLSSNGVKPAYDCKDEEPELPQPDLVRVVDIATDRTPQGLLAEISEDDFQDTDIFVFRESTGMLITQRKGKDLREGASHYAIDNNKFTYQIFMRGPASDAFYNYAMRRTGGEAGFIEYQSKSHMNPELHRREADHLKPNEMLRIVLINRKTGYIGTALRSFWGIADDRHYMSILHETRMYPPNLKVTAERIFEPNKNSIKTGQQKNVISYEGSALSSDSMLVLTTEWFDNDGTPLPAGLADFGYTGRLAKVAGNNSLVTVGGELANFAIKPGRNIVQINLPGGASTNEHFYVNVSGEPISESPSFEEIGAGDGPLAHRPKYYVPFKVPVFNEELTTDLNFKYKKAVEAGEAGDLAKPEPVYHYVYRPEYQFSTYELKVNDILRKTADDNVISLYPKERPLIGSSDDMVTMMYDLLASNSDALEFLGEGQELVFSLGADEIKATIGESGQVRFERLDHIAALDVEDFVTLSLYNNTDPTNVLWDYAFEAVALDTRWAGYDNIGEDGTIYVSADDPVVPLQSLIVGYANRQNKTPIEIKWDAKGSGSFISLDNNNAENGVFAADIQLPPYTGTRATPFVYFAGDKDNYVIMDAIEVVPGEPANLSVTGEGDAYMEGLGQINIELEAKDKNGNLVADGTSFIYSLDGHGIVSEASDSFTNGKASLIVKGGYLPDDELKLKVTTGNVSQELDLVIQPLTVVIEDYPLNMEAGQVYEVRAKVTKPGGGAAQGVSVWFETNGGRLERGTLTTNADGLVTAKIHTGFHALEQVQISARVGLVEGDVVEGDITAKPIQSAALRMQTAKQFGQKSQFSKGAQLNARIASMASPVTQQNAANSIDVLVFGEADVDGALGLTREDDSVIKLPYSVTGNLELNGQENTSQFVTLGTLSEPNLQPISAYFMSELVEELVTDANQLHNGKASFVKLVNDHPTQTGFSYQFKKHAEKNPVGEWLPSQIVVPADERFKPVNSVGFRLDLKASAFDSTVFDFEGGAQGLNLNQDGTLTYYLHNKSGKISVTSTNAVNLSQWVTIAGKYQGGELQLEVNGQLTTINVPDTPLVYSVTSRGLTIGKGLDGNLSSVKFYNYESQPLLSFTDGTQAKQIDFNTGQSQTLLPIKSTGQLNKNGESAGVYRIGINVDGKQYFASVIGEQGYLQMMRMMAAFNPPDGYPPVAFNSTKYTPFPFVPVAHAWFDFSWEGAWEGFKAVAGAIIPYEAIGVVAEQVVFLANGDSRFDPLELALNAIEVLTIVPLAKPLIPIIRPVKAVFKSVKALNPKFLKSLGGVIGKTMDHILKRDFDKALTILPFLIIAGEMAADAEAREGLMVLIKSISSSDDIFAWMEYLSLPADGWEGNSIPDVNLTALHSVKDTQPYFSPLNAVMPVAYAKKKFTLRRISGLVAGRNVLKAFKTGNGKLITDPKLLSTAVRSITKLLKDSGKYSDHMRKIPFTPTLLASTAVLAKRGIKNTKKAMRRSDLRVHPVILMGSLLYLETSLANGTLTSDNGNFIEFGELLAKIFLTGETKRATANRHGAMFHLIMLAYYQAKHEFAGGLAIYAIEGARKFDYFNGTASYLKYSREVDIILGEKDDEHWVELKSKKWPFNPGQFGVWQLTAQKKKATIHKQFSFDWVMKHFKSDLLKENQMKPPKNVAWRFHSFTSKDKKEWGPKEKHFKQKHFSGGENLREKLCNPPKAPRGDADSTILKDTTGKRGDELKALCLANQYDIIRIQNNKTILNELAKNGLLDDVMDKLKEADLID